MFRLSPGEIGEEGVVVVMIVVVLLASSGGGTELVEAEELF